MHERTILGWLLIGLVAGVVGRLVMPGRDPGGLVGTVLVGIAGALLAGFIVEAAGVELTGAGARYGAAAVGAAVLLALYRLIVARRVR